VLAHQAPLKRGNALAEVANQWTQPCMAREVPASCRYSCNRDEPDRLARAGAPRWRRPAFTQTSQQEIASAERQPPSARRPPPPPCSQGQPAAAHRPPKARQLPLPRTCNRRTPRPPNGVEQQPGRSPVPTAPSSARVVVRGAYPLRCWAITSSSSTKTTQRTSALPQSSGIEGVPPVSLGRRGAIACARLNAASDLGSPGQAAPNGRR
jgi:hypothetical protein